MRSVRSRLAVLVSSVALLSACTGASETTVEDAAVIDTNVTFCDAMTQPVGATSVSRDELGLGSTRDRLDSGANGQVYMEPGATDAEIDGMREMIIANPDLELVRFVTQAQAYEEFQQMFADSEQTLATNTEADMPPSFEIALRDDFGSADERQAATNAFAEVAQTRPGFFDIAFLVGGHTTFAVNDQATIADLLLWSSLSPVLLVFLNPDVEPSERLAVAELLDSRGARYQFVDQEEAYEEFLVTFADNPQLRDSVQVADVPPSFRAEFVPGLRDASSDFQALSGVFEVATPNSLDQSFAVAANHLLNLDRPTTLMAAAVQASPQHEAAVDVLVNGIAGLAERESPEEFLAATYPSALELRDVIADECGVTVDFFSESTQVLMFGKPTGS